MRIIRIKVGLGCLILTLLALVGCSEPLVTEEIKESYTVKPNTILEIYNPNGSVSVSIWDGDSVEIEAVKKSYHGVDALEEVDIFISIAEVMKIETEHPPGRNTVTVNYEIKIPWDVRLGVVECSNGNISVNGVTGNPDLRTSNGNIEAISVQGVVYASGSNGNITVTESKSIGFLRTSNGNIEAELESLREDVSIRTSNGSITFYASSELEANISAATSNGTVSVSDLSIETVELEQTILTGTMNGGGRKVDLTTSNGSIELRQLR